MMLCSCTFGARPRRTSPLWRKIEASARPVAPARPWRARWRVILEEVAASHYLSVADVLGRDRRRRYTAARFEAAYRLYAETTLSFTQIAKCMGGRDHSSVIYAVDRHMQLRGITEIPSHRRRSHLRRTRFGPKVRKRVDRTAHMKRRQHDH